MPNSPFYERLLAERTGNPRIDGDGNLVLPETATGRVVRAMGGPDTRDPDFGKHRREDPVFNALAAAVLDDDPCAFSEDGDMIEPDHPDSLLVKHGLI